jgi:hypothetical protein
MYLALKDTTMAEDKELYGQVSAMSKEAAKQAHEALDTYFDFIKKTISSLPSGGTQFGEKLKSHAEQNVTTTQEYVKKLSEAKTIQDALRIQTEYMRAQFTTFGEQAKDIMETFQSDRKD